MTGFSGRQAGAAQLADLVRWLAAVLLGLLVTLAAVRAGAHLGTAAAPFLGWYRPHLAVLGALAPAVGLAVLLVHRTGWLDRARWPALLLFGYAAALLWMLSLAVSGGTAGLSRWTGDPAGYLAEISRVGDHPLRYLRQYTALAGRTPAASGHPPGLVLLLWLAYRAGLHSQVGLGVAVAATGALAVPLVLAAVRSVCGPLPARRYLPVLALAPYALWMAVSADAVVATLGAAMVLLGIRASEPARRGARSAGWALGSGVMLGAAALFAYSVAWLGLSVACLYFARRRPLANLATALGALAVVLAADMSGFNWLTGLRLAGRDIVGGAQPHRSAAWWSLVSLVALLVVAGPPLVASARKVRNTPGWPFLVGATAAVAFSVLTGLARGGVEHAWLPFFPWLTVAAVAPERPAGPPVPVPLLLVAAGAFTGVVLAAVLRPVG